MFGAIVDTIFFEEAVNKEDVLVTPFQTLRDNVWDCADESKYIDHPIIRAIIEKCEPGWFDCEDED